MNDKVNRADWSYVPVDPEPNFDPEHNRRVIDQVIQSNEANRKRKKREFDAKMGERTSAVAGYVKHLADTKGNTTVEQYFGSKYLAHLRGEQIIRKLKDAKEQAQRKAQGLSTT